MATSKAGGSTQNNRESHSKRLGVKKFGGEVILGGQIIMRQRGTQFHPGLGVGPLHFLLGVTAGEQLGGRCVRAHALRAGVHYVHLVAADNLYSGGRVARASRRMTPDPAVPLPVGVERAQ